MRIILFLLAFVSLPSFSADFYWIKNGVTAVHYSSAISACSGYIAGSYVSAHHVVFFNSGRSATCYMNTNYNAVSAAGDVARLGDSCPDKYTYNSATGACDAPQLTACEKLTGATRTFIKIGVAPDDFVSVGSGGRPSTKREGCFDGCYAEMTDVRCTHKTTGAYNCRLQGTFSGASCDSNTNPAGPNVLPNETPEPEPVTENTKLPCVYKTNADGTQSCESTAAVDKEGKNCGTFNGESVCVDKNANKNEVKVKTDVKTAPTADGGTKITKTDTMTVTACTGINSCSTSVSTNVTTTTKDSSGNTTGSSSSCTGSSCSGGSGSGDSDGDGLDDCTSDCSGGSPTDAVLDEVASFGDSTESFVNRLENSRLATSLRNIRAPSGGDCYAPRVEVPWLGTVTFDGHCQVLEGNINFIKLIAKTLWAIAAVWILFG